MPLLPQMVYESYYAGGRLGYNTWVAKNWTKNTPKTYVILFTRVLAKTSKLALALKEWLLTVLKEKGILERWMQVCMHSDCGPQLARTKQFNKHFRTLREANQEIKAVEAAPDEPAGLPQPVPMQIGGGSSSG